MNKHIVKMNSVLVFLALLWAFFFPLGSFVDSIGFSAGTPQLLTEYNPKHVYFPNKLWLKASSPELMGWSSEKLKDAREYTLSHNTSAVVIVDNGVIVDEWGKPQKRYTLHSVRKSLMNALYGIQVDAGKIDLSDTLETLGIDDWEPLSKDEKQATIAELLQARSGVYHPAAYETYSMRTRRPARGSHPHGSIWFYNNWDFNSLITIYEQQTGTKMGKAFYTQIAQPLKMEQFRISDTRHLFKLEKSRHPAFLVLMSARDLARFGLLYLHNGNWNNRQILSEKWIQESMIPYSQTRLKNHLAGYGYLWWISEKGFAAVGSGGQTLIVIPELRLIVVHLAEKIGGNDMLAHSRVAKLLEIIISAGPSANNNQGSIKP